MVAEPKHILIVDDEADICNILQAHLSERGCDVSVAIDASRARDILKSQQIDVLISDQLMFGEMGLQLADFARSLGVPTILMSGDLKSIETLSEKKHAFIQKPFHLADLTEPIEHVLALPPV
jgi:DNA-binding NtrC family response regulator